jgi:SOS response regulatory protein OraA/RecX
MGIAPAVAAEALGDVFGELDERALIARAMQKKLRGRTTLASPNEYARLYQYLMRQGFSPGGVAAALRTLRGGRGAGGHEE